jgi:LysR family transcriptional activator of nhaA
MRDLNYNHLRYFWVVAHEGSLTRAATRLHLSQSALSVQVQKLEAQIGHPLFERIGKRLKLTEAGRIALDYADTVFSAGAELLSTLQGRPVDRRRMLTIGSLTTLSRNFQLDFLRPLIGRDDVEIVVRSGAMRDLLAQLESHAMDVVLSNSAVPRDARTPLRHYLLNEQSVSLVGKPRRRRKPFRFPDDLRHEPVLLPGPDSELRMAFDRLLELAGIRPIILAEVDDMAMLRLMAREHDAVTLVPPIVVRDELKARVLVEHCQIPSVKESFYAIVLKRQFPNPLVSALVERQAPAR